MSWQDALDAFEASVATVEVALDRGVWTGWRQPEAPAPGDDPASAADRERFADLQRRSERCVCRLEAAMAQAVEKLRAIEHRRSATRGYLMSQLSRMPESSPRA